MIIGNQTWQAGLADLQKQPCYILEIPTFGVFLATCSDSVLQDPTLSGYGVSLYGLAGYGT